jgi:hypothetical protein
MSKTPVQLQPLDQAVSAQLSAITVLPKITCPYTTVTKRAQCTDFSQDLLPRFGVDRVMTQAIQEVQGESGPNGERVFKSINDIHDAVRFIGTWSSNSNINGVWCASSVNDYMEITFYGTGLNMLVYQDATSRAVTIAIDGSGSTVVPNIGSGVITNRNTSVNAVLNVASGLTLGLHTVRITSSAASNTFYGYEVLNTNSTLQQTPGTSYLGGKRLYQPALTTSSPTSGFTNTYGTAGSKGSHVLVYQKPDGTVAKDARYTEVNANYTTSASHTNEDVIRYVNFREFGAGRSDDFSTLTPTTPSARAFTLDDGTTTLVSSANNSTNATSGQPDALRLGAVSGDFVTLTFVGTGLDITRIDDGTGTDTYTLTVDGTSQGNLNTTGSTSARIEKLCSGLPYGTHTVKIARSTTASFRLQIINFIVYGPAKPTLPAGCVELADYYVMADQSVNATAGADTVSNGSIRKSLAREFVYANGTGGTSDWVLSLPDTTQVNAGRASTDRTNAFVQYTFFGTGFDLRFLFGSSRSSSITLSLNGSTLNSTNFPTMSSATFGVVSKFNASTGVLDQSNGSQINASGLTIRGLTLGLYTVKMTNNTTALMEFSGIDIITPIHAPKSNGPGDLQNTLLVGSCALSDNRKFSELAVKPLTNWAQAVGITSGPSTTSTSFVPMPDMSCTIKTSGNPIQITYSCTVNSPLGQNVFAEPYVDGISSANMPITGANSTIMNSCLSGTVIYPVAAGVHKVDLYWKVDGGTGSLNGVRRIISVREL